MKLGFRHDIFRHQYQSLLILAFVVKVNIRYKSPDSFQQPESIFTVLNLVKILEISATEANDLQHPSSVMDP